MEYIGAQHIACMSLKNIGENMMPTGLGMGLMRI